MQRAVSPGTKANDREVIVVRPCALSTSPFENRKCLTIRQREGLIPPLAAELPRSFEVLVYQWLTAHASREYSGQQLVAAVGADFASEQKPQLGEHRINRPDLLAPATYLSFGALSVGVMRIIADQKGEQCARVNEKH
jgi:hypothetical protein